MTARRPAVDEAGKFGEERPRELSSGRARTRRRRGRVTCSACLEETSRSPEGAGARLVATASSPNRCTGRWPSIRRVWSSSRMLCNRASQVCVGFPSPAPRTISLRRRRGRPRARCAQPTCRIAARPGTSWSWNSPTSRWPSPPTIPREGARGQSGPSPPTGRHVDRRRQRRRCPTSSVPWRTGEPEIQSTSSEASTCAAGMPRASSERRSSCGCSKRTRSVVPWSGVWARRPTRLP